MAATCCWNQPDIAVIKLGTNDSKPQNTVHLSEFKNDLEQMIKSLGKARIILCTPIPAFKSSWGINDSVIVNDIIPIQQEVARKYGLKVIDLHTLMANDEELVQPDGIHPNEKGVAKMAEIIAAAIK